MHAGVLHNADKAKYTIRTGLISRQALIAYIFLFPALLFFTIFYFVPIGIEVGTSLYNNLDSGTFVGLQNYIQAFHDARVLNALNVTVLFALGVTVLGIVLGLGLALVLDQPLRGRVIFRTILLIPYLSSSVIIGLMWRNILDPVVGILNRILMQWGLPGQSWLSSYHGALPTVIGITVWQLVGYNMILFLAGLQGIPEDYYQAARIDGANSWHRLRFITIPLLAPTTLFVSIMSIISSLQAFAQAYIITQGGPADATRFFVFHVFDVAFNQNNLTYASALTFLMFLIVLLVTIVQLCVSRNSLEY